MCTLSDNKFSLAISLFLAPRRIISLDILPWFHPCLCFKYNHHCYLNWNYYLDPLSHIFSSNPSFCLTYVIFDSKVQNLPGQTPWSIRRLNANGGLSLGISKMCVCLSGERICDDLLVPLPASIHRESDQKQDKTLRPLLFLLFPLVRTQLFIHSIFSHTSCPLLGFLQIEYFLLVVDDLRW